MSEMSISVIQEELVLSALRDLRNGQVEEATGHFADQFRFKDHRIGLEFNDKQRSAEFFQKTRELYPETEPFYGGLKWRVPVSLHGTSIVRTENGKITSSAEYYDGLTARRITMQQHNGCLGQTT
jgi:hypothetical protein